MTNVVLEGYFWVLLSEKNLKIKKKRLEIHDKIAFFSSRSNSVIDWHMSTLNLIMD